MTYDDEVGNCAACGAPRAMDLPMVQPSVSHPAIREYPVIPASSDPYQPLSTAFPYEMWLNKTRY